MQPSAKKSSGGKLDTLTELMESETSGQASICASAVSASHDPSEPKNLGFRRSSGENLTIKLKNPRMTPTSKSSASSAGNKPTEKMENVTKIKIDSARHTPQQMIVPITPRERNSVEA